MECIVLAGGLGTRLANVLHGLPKCMAPVDRKPFLHYLLKYLENQSVSRIILSLGYGSEAIMEYIEQHSWPFNIVYSIEDDPLGTGGAIKLSLENAHEKNVWVLNGDTFFDVDMKKMHDEHILSNADISLALKQMRDFDRYGTVKMENDRKITSFVEKKQCKKGLINGGIYLIRNSYSLFDKHIGKFSFENDILEKSTTSKNIHGFISDGYFIDIGVPLDYQRVSNEIEYLK
jgi:D-glycero-alpha-D-manno-heptose 1-phosphate guanylyltransferase